MASTLINLTLLKLNDELENFLVIYPDKIYQEILTDPEFRLELIAYVLNRTPNRYITVELGNVTSTSSDSVVSSTEESVRLERLIHQGISHISQKKNLIFRSVEQLIQSTLS